MKREISFTISYEAIYNKVEFLNILIINYIYLKFTYLLLIYFNILNF
jgi:hypothetical protein